MDREPGIKPHVLIEPRQRPGRRTINWRILAVIAAALVVILSGAFIVGRVLADDDSPEAGTQMSTQDLTLPADPPAEWSRTALWKSPPLLPSAVRVLVIGSTRVAMVTKDRKVVLVDAATGKSSWSADLGDGDMRTPLSATQVDGTNVIAAQLGDRLRWWSILDGHSDSIDLPAGASVSFFGQAPLIDDQHGTVSTLTSGQLHSLTVPKGATAFGARSDGTVTLASPAGWWHLRAGQNAGAPTPFETTSSTSPALTPIAMCGGVLITMTPINKGQNTVVLYSDRPTDVRWLAQGAMRMTTNQGVWRCSTSRTWGILSRSLINLTSGDVRDLGPWVTVQIAADRALGQIGNQRVIAGPSIPPGVLTPAERFPDDLVKINDGRVGALVRPATDANADPVVYLLPPR